VLVISAAEELLRFCVLYCHVFSMCMKLYSSPEMLPTTLDDDKMYIDDEAISKLLEKFYQQHGSEQSVNVCSAPPQLTTPVTGELLRPSATSSWGSFHYS